MIPELTKSGVLPPGVHDGTVQEVERRFGRFQGSDRRPRLWSRLREFITLAADSGLIEAVIVDGSFITAVADPNDIDLVVVLPESHDLGGDVPPTIITCLLRRECAVSLGSMCWWSRVAPTA